ncbi:TIGR04222 domain-containing membrane protein [Yinghuangia soli]|uniref:TIGR04222 domain-containing membrane protein n=1 Tax=Yinghuangia soli TaxID=2908204 RepID=A0AA41PWQ8_9ACTN|nr:TIGR04222 domain-containing membrane protein [Yinghuangia soli]MCF2526254.1 TIGR04222 domain-containing membrane protein [Yinghuangia soli]
MTISTAALLAVGAAFLPRARRGPGPSRGGDPDRELDLYEVAFLAGGPGRTAYTALVGLVDTGKLHLTRDGQLTVPTGTAQLPPVPAAVRAAALTGGRNTAVPMPLVRTRGAKSRAVEQTGMRLAADGLAVLPGYRPRLAVRYLAACAFALSAGAFVVPLMAFPLPVALAVAVAGLAGSAGLWHGVHSLQGRTLAGRARLRLAADDPRFAPGGPYGLAGQVALHGPKGLPPGSGFTVGGRQATAREADALRRNGSHDSCGSRSGCGGEYTSSFGGPHHDSSGP